MTDMRYSVALIGLGGIGMGYDSSLPAKRYIYSHARAFALHPDFTLWGGVDPVPTHRERFSEDYAAAAYATTTELLAQAVSDGAPDVVIVASPTDTHAHVVEEVLRHCRPRLILCEKPLAYDANEAEAMVRLCSQAGVLLCVNYIRRADPGVIEVKARLDDGRIASPLKAVVWYSKGLLHNGSHFLDLMTFWLGPVRRWRLIEPGAARGAQDADADVRIVFERGAAIFCAAKEEDFSHYTVEMVAPNGRLRYEQGGRLAWQAAAAHPTLAGYRQLQAAVEEIANDMDRYQYHVAEQISLALEGKAHILCDGAAGADNIRLLQTILQQRTNNQE